MTTKPTIVLVPGAWHGPQSFAPLTSQLEAAGYNVRGVTLPSVGPPQPLKDLQPDAEAIRTVVREAVEDEQDVLVLMHSYGSVPAGEAVKGLDKVTRRKDNEQGGVSHLFYCSAFVLPKGVAQIDALGGQAPPWSYLSTSDQLIHVSDPTKMFYHDVPADLAKSSVAALKPHSFRTFFWKPTWEPYREIPSTYLLCAQDEAIPLAAQQGMVDGAKGVKWNTVTMDTSHSPFLADPEKMARIVRKAAGETI